MENKKPKKDKKQHYDTQERHDKYMCKCGFESESEWDFYKHLHPNAVFQDMVEENYNT